MKAFSVLLPSTRRHWEIGFYCQPARKYRPAYLHGWRGAEKSIVAELRAGFNIEMVNPQGDCGLRRPWNRNLEEE